jgi:hypothetical protein
MPCSPLKVNRRFGAIYRLHLQGWRISWARYLCDIHTCHLISHWYLAQFILHPRRLVDAQQITSRYTLVPLIFHHNKMKNMPLTNRHMSMLTVSPLSESVWLTTSLLPYRKTCHLLSCWYIAWLSLQPWRWWQYIPSKRRLTFNGLHGIISQKIVLFIITAVGIPNPAPI